jgi:WD40 repeat protein
LEYRTKISTLLLGISLRNLTCLATIGDDLFVSGSFDHSMIVWETAHLAFNSVFRCEAVDIQNSMLDETHIIYPSEKAVKIWSTNFKAEFKDHSDKVLCVAKYSDFIFSGSLDISVRVWSVTNQALITIFTGHNDNVSAVAMCGDIIASGSYDETVRLWNIKQNKECGV